MSVPWYDAHSQNTLDAGSDIPAFGRVLHDFSKLVDGFGVSRLDLVSDPRPSLEGRQGC